MRSVWREKQKLVEVSEVFKLSWVSSNLHQVVRDNPDKLDSTKLWRLECGYSFLIQLKGYENLSIGKIILEESMMFDLVEQNELPSPSGF